MTKLVPSAASKGAPGLAFETWDPSNQFPLETPILLFVIPSEAEGPAVRSTGHQSQMETLLFPCHPEEPTCLRQVKSEMNAEN
jgi:hypothetical protein